MLYKNNFRKYLPHASYCGSLYYCDRIIFQVENTKKKIDIFFIPYITNHNHKKHPSNLMSFTRHLMAATHNTYFIYIHFIFYRLFFRHTHRHFNLKSVLTQPLHFLSNASSPGHPLRVTYIRVDPSKST